MSAPRATMSPPDLLGYRFQRLLGSGGYSDVFLYEQEMPRRPVAIKVLLASSLDDVGRMQFADEANTMAALSTHPFIVTIFHAEVGPGGRPFLVMEFYPRPNFSVRARTEQMSLATVLRTGIQVASSVETAHRAGILHRDIKPANILTSEYGRPGLTDFGIASTAIDGVVKEAEGMSIPWSPPEVVSGSATGDETADVYSLGATIYTLLAGRSPFEIQGGSNRSLDLITRIEHSELPATGRGDVPESLERLLRQAMSKTASDRPRSAAALARALQEIEVDHQLAMTPLEVRDEGLEVRSRNDGSEDGTRLKAPVVIRSQTAGAPSSERTGGAPGVDDGTTSAGGTMHRSSTNSDGLISGVRPMPTGGPGVQAVPEQLPYVAPTEVTTHRGSSEAPGQTPLSEPSAGTKPNQSKVVAVASVILVIVVALVIARVVTSSGDVSEGAKQKSTDEPPPTQPIDINALLPAPTAVRVSMNPDGGAVVSWDLPEGANPATRYEVIGNDDKKLGVSGPGDVSLVVDAERKPTPCVSVQSKLATRTSKATTGCMGDS